MTAEVVLLFLLLETGWAFKLSVRKAMMGKDVNIPCSFTVKNYPIDRKFLLITWYFQGKEILRVQNAVVKPTDPRMSYTGRAEDGIADLSIDNVTIMDGGIYKCSIYYKNEKKEEEIRLDVQALPQITIANKVVVKNRVSSVHSVISGFYPVDIDIKWLRDGEILKDVTEEPQRDPDGTYSVRSSVTIIPTKEDRERIFSCRVQHESLTAPLQEDFQLVYGDLTAKYRLHVVTASVVLVVIFGALTIVLLYFKQRKKRLPKVRSITRSLGYAFSLNIDHFYPEDIDVSWYLVQPPSSTQPLDIRSEIIKQRNQDGTFNATSTCESLRGTIKKDQTYVVRAEVVHSKLKRPSYREWRSHDKDNTDFLVPPQVEEVQIPKLFFKEQTQLRCTMSHFFPDELTVDWLLKENGKEEFILLGDSGRYKIPNTESQLRVDKTFTHTAVFEFTPLIEDVESEIICRVSHPSLEEPIYRTTGLLQVLAKPALQQPIKLSLTDSGDVVGHLTLVNFYPKNIKVAWTCNLLQNLEKMTTAEVTDNSDGTFTLYSQQKIIGNLLANPQFVMRVTWNHETMEEPEKREISVKDPDFPWRPRIEDISPLILQKGKETKVTCKISGYFPENLRVTWLEKKGKNVTDCIRKTNKYNVPNIKHERMPDNSYQCAPSLSFTPTSDEEDLEFICRVEHPSLGQPLEQSTGPPVINVPPQEPTAAQFTIHESGKVLCSLSLMKFYPKNINISWSQEERHPRTLPSTKKIIETDDEKTLEAVSECIVPWRQFKSSVRVTWSHDSLKEPRWRDLRITDFPWQPVIEQIDKSPLIENANAKLRFKISHYFPSESLDVSWHMKGKNGKPVFKTWKTDITGAQLQPDKTYSCTASLQFTPSLPKDQGSEFICRVQHPTLGEPIEGSTGPLQICARPQFQDPIQKSLTNGRQVALILPLHRFYPHPIDIKWSCSCGQSLRVEDNYENNADTTFNVKSECRVPQQHVKHPRPTIRVTWKHITMADAESREVCVRESVIPTIKDSVKLTPCESGEVLCSVHLQKFFPKNINFTWTFGGEEHHRYTPKKTLIVEDNVEEFSAISEYRIPWKLLQFPVRVSWEHESLREPQYTELPGPDFLWLPHVEEQDPPCLILNSESKIQCRISGYFPKDLTVSWYEKEENTDNLIPVTSDRRYKIPGLTHHRQPDNTYSCTASLLFTPTPKDQGLEFICNVGHPRMEPIIKRIRPLPLMGLLRRPQIASLAISDQELGTECEIECSVSGYSPDNVTITWLSKRKYNDDFSPITNKSKYKIPDIAHHRQPDNTYRCAAVLLITSLQREDQGCEFMCRVQHPSLERPIERRTEALQPKPGKNPQIRDTYGTDF